MMKITNIVLLGLFLTINQLHAQQLNAGSGNFCFSNSFDIGDTHDYSEPIAVDINNDMLKDIVVFDYTVKQIQYFKNNNGIFNALPSLTLQNTSNIKSITTGDFNADGWSDIALLNNAGNIFIYQNNNGISFTYTVSLNPPTAFTSSVLNIYSIDLDVDNYPEILITGFNSGLNQYTYFTQKISPNYTYTTSIETTITALVGGLSTKLFVAFGDFNSDAKSDIAFTTSPSAGTINLQTSTILGPINLFAANTTTHSVSGVTNCESLKAADYDGDYIVDIGFLASTGANAGFIQFLNNGSAVFNQYNVPIITNSKQYAYEDFNGNGLRDYLSLDKANGNLYANEGLTDLSVTPTTSLSTTQNLINNNFPSNTRDFSVSDLDNNGYTDIIIAGSASNVGKIKYFKNYSYPVVITSNNNAVSCNNSTVTLNASTTNNITSGTYNWSNGFTGAMATESTAGSIYADYNFNLPNGGYCILPSNKIVITATVGTLPIVNFTGPTTIFCDNAMQQFTLAASVSNSTNYYWDKIALNYSTTINNDTIMDTPQINTYYLFTAENGGCYATVSYTPIVNAVPVLNNDPNTYFSVCNGNSQTLFVVPTQSATSSIITQYSWVDNSGMTYPSNDTIIVNPITYTTYTAIAINQNCPSNSITFTVNVNALPNIAAVFTPTICKVNSDAIQYNTNSNYSYTTSANTSVISTSNSFTTQPSITTTYSVIVYDSNYGCVKDSTYKIYVDITPTLSISSNTICAGNSTTLLATGAQNYIWNTGSTQNTVTVTPQTVNSYTVTGKNGVCPAVTATTSVKVNPNPLIYITANATSICPVIETVTLTSAGMPTSGSYDYHWENGLGNNAVAQSTIGLAPEIFTVTVKNTITGCSSFTTITITSKPVPNMNISASSNTICTNTEVKLTVNPTAANNFTWVASNSTYSLNTSSISQTLTAPTSYTVYGKSISNGCIGRDIADISIYPPQNVNALATPSAICIGDYAILSVSGGSTSDVLFNNSAVSPNINTTYTVTIADNNNCLYERSVTIVVKTDCGAKPYSVFSPNGDGKNDIFYIENINAHQNKVHIYDRWGIELFKTENYNNLNNAWDGRFNNKYVPSGTYFYVIELLDTNQLQKGWLEIVGN